MMQVCWCVCVCVCSFGVGVVELFALVCTISIHLERVERINSTLKQDPKPNKIKSSRVEPTEILSKFVRLLPASSLTFALDWMPNKIAKH